MMMGPASRWYSLVNMVSSSFSQGTFPSLIILMWRQTYVVRRQCSGSQFRISSTQLDISISMAAIIMRQVLLIVISTMDKAHFVYRQSK